MSHDPHTLLEREAEDFADAAIRHNVTPAEAISVLRAAWANKLEDRKKLAEYSFKEATRG